MNFECAFQCELEDLEPRPALTIRLKTKAGDIAEMFDQGFSAIASYLEEKGKKPQGPPFAIYYNMDMDHLEVEFGFPVEEGIDGNASIQASMTPSGKAVTSLYIGPYEEAEPVYDALMKWISDNELEATGVAYEIYLNDPALTPPEQLKTQVYLLLVR
ncbi:MULTISPECIES: GyrI-like domain-containing protein [unclassified Prosthecochloris]|uniref:GyrI-like domain-containing protein n=1 Tax=unclassified Prosthecochloris TaxID=2632826 RepID=UPI00223D8FBF|nr:MULTISPECIES: GyrI-like domain-containing protein [unclassified Prosthecochloris]UZJ39181.1 GyrI-like domain-containing protein [Prosthecochloris sp. SCSIO W1102]